MLISDALASASALTGQAIAEADAVRWLSELDGRLAFELYRADAWTPYDPASDLDSELLVPFPWDGLYVHHLEAMTYYTNGEYDRYEPARAMSERTLTDFRHFLQRTQARPGVPGFPTDRRGGSAVTVIPPRTDAPWFWLSAYALAVKHGFSGSESEWLASLVGAGSGDMKASDYDPSGDVARAGGVGAYVLAAASARQEKIARGTLTLSDAWAGAGPYTQTVTVTGAVCGAGSRVDLQPSAAQLAALLAADVRALVIENDGGVLTAHALGGRPSAAMTVQCTLTEVGP